MLAIALVSQLADTGYYSKKYYRSEARKWEQHYRDIEGKLEKYDEAIREKEIIKVLQKELDNAKNNLTNSQIEVRILRETSNTLTEALKK